MRTYDDWKTTDPNDATLGPECDGPDPDAARERIRDDALWDHGPKLDPYFGAATGKELMFELRLSVIECEISNIAKHVDVLWFKEWFRASQAASLARYDIPRTIQKMRDAADRLEKLTGAERLQGDE